MTRAPVTDRDFKDEINSYVKTISVKSGKVNYIIDPKGAPSSILFHDNDIILFLHEMDRPDKDPAQLLRYFSAYNKKYRVIHIWEDQWIFHTEKIKSLILSLLGQTKRIHGRETAVQKIDNAQLIDFLTENHMNVPIKAKYKFGLFKGGVLTAVMSFSKPRPVIRKGKVYNSYELLRFCNSLNTTVVGGFSKLLHHFIKLYDPDDIMTYIDADRSDGKAYEQSGFELVGELPPIEFLLNMNTGEREYKHLVLKNRGIEPGKDKFPKKNQYKRVYNSGSYKYLLLRK